MDKALKERIEKKAYAIWEYRQINNVPGNAEEDWLEAMSEIITDRRKEGCPLCGFKLLARNDSEIFCLRTGCDFKITAKRLLDKDKPDFKELKKDWQ